MDKYRIGYLDEDKGDRITVRRALRADFDVYLFDITADFTPDCPAHAELAGLKGSI
jgi:hypothetical protein